MLRGLSAAFPTSATQENSSGLPLIKGSFVVTNGLLTREKRGIKTQIFTVENKRKSSETG